MRPVRRARLVVAAACGAGHAGVVPLLGPRRLPGVRQRVQRAGPVLVEPAPAAEAPRVVAVVRAEFPPLLRQHRVEAQVETVPQVGPSRARDQLEVPVRPLEADAAPLRVLTPGTNRVNVAGVIQEGQAVAGPPAVATAPALVGVPAAAARGPATVGTVGGAPLAVARVAAGLLRTVAHARVAAQGVATAVREAPAAPHADAGPAREGAGAGAVPTASGVVGVGATRRGATGGAQANEATGPAVATGRRAVGGAAVRARPPIGGASRPWLA